MATRVYKYGARPSRDPALLEQMRLGRKYYNALVEAENARRAEAWGGETAPLPPEHECTRKEEIDKDGNTRKQRCKICDDHWNAVRKAVRELPLLDVKPLRAEYAALGLFWGTYLVIEQAFAAAWKSTKSHLRVRFRSWRQGDVAAVQVQRSRLEGLDRLFRIVKSPDHRKGRRARDGLGRHTVQIRIGSDDKRNPIFCEPIRIEKHREMTGRPTWVHVRRRWSADREIWSVAFTCADVAERTDEAKHGVVAVDASWRKMPDGTWRLGLAQDGGRYVNELRMPPEWAERSKRADDIRKYRDTRLNEVRSQWPVIKETKSCQKAVRRLLGLGVLTEEQRAWVDREMHLWRYEVGCRRRSVDARRAKLREWARALRRRCAEVVVKDTQHKQIKEEHGLPQPAQRQGQHAAPGETIEVLREVFGDDRMWVVAAKDTTAGCPRCGHVTPHNGELMVRCEECGARRDRDLVSTENMLALHEKGESRKPTARKSSARFAKRHAKSEVPPECPLDG